jgi:hypothetical protein
MADPPRAGCASLVHGRAFRSARSAGAGSMGTGCSANMGAAASVHRGVQIGRRARVLAKPTGAPLSQRPEGEESQDAAT